MINCNTKKSCKTKCDKKALFFTQFLCEENIVVPEQKLDIEDVVSVLVEPEIISLRVIDTPIGCSAEGQNLTGKKLSIEIKMKQKVVYVAQREVQSVHVVENECYKSALIVIPQFIYGSKVENLLSHNCFRVDVEVENASAMKVNNRNIYKSVLLFIKAKVIPNYLLCYVEDYNCHSSELYITFEDGTRKKEVGSFNEGKIIMPQWSPCGSRVAYICKRKESSFLCISDIKGSNTYKVTDIGCFKYVSSFSWCDYGNSILFTAVLRGSKEIFRINVNTLEWKQLTYGSNRGSSIRPKPSFNNEYIGYIKISSDIRSLYVMRKNGLGNKNISKLEYVKDFCWENNHLRIAAICNNINSNNYNFSCGKGIDEIFLINIQCDDIICLNISEFMLSIRKVKFSLDNRYISFIGEYQGIQDIYLYDLLKNEMINLTENECGVEIGDYDWHIESTGIYFSCNELDYYNVFFLDICNKTKTQISNTEANNIKICFRPKII